MKSLLVSLLFLAGCVTSGMKTVETKYLPDECLKLTAETVQSKFPGQEKEAELIVIQVLAVGNTGYVIVQYALGQQLSGPQFVKTDSVNSELMVTECPSYLQPEAAPADPEE